VFGKLAVNSRYQLAGGLGQQFETPAQRAARQRTVAHT
jgi:hypothetical protein